MFVDVWQINGHALGRALTHGNVVFGCDGLLPQDIKTVRQAYWFVARVLEPVALEVACAPMCSGGDWRGIGCGCISSVGSLSLLDVCTIVFGTCHATPMYTCPHHHHSFALHAQKF
jgi:hypothetical protein